MTPQEAAAALRAMGGRLETELTAALDRTRGRAAELAEGVSSEPYDRNQLAREDHPFARRHGTPKRDPRFLGQVTGDFARAWVTDPVARQGDSLASALANTDPKAAAWLEPGTETMVPRRPDEAIAELLEPEFEQVVDAALLRALGG